MKTALVALAVAVSVLAGCGSAPEAPAKTQERPSETVSATVAPTPTQSLSEASKELVDKTVKEGVYLAGVRGLFKTNDLALVEGYATCKAMEDPENAKKPLIEMMNRAGGKEQGKQVLAVSIATLCPEMEANLTRLPQ